MGRMFGNNIFSDIPALVAPIMDEDWERERDRERDETEPEETEWDSEREEDPEEERDAERPRRGFAIVPGGSGGSGCGRATGGDPVAFG